MAIITQYLILIINHLKTKFIYKISINSLRIIIHQLIISKQFNNYLYLSSAEEEVLPMVKEIKPPHQQKERTLIKIVLKEIKIIK